jgi:hypothetical protein
VSERLVHALVALDSSGWGPLAFGPPVQVIEARALADVLPAVRAAEAAAEAAARAGRWVVGFVAYEAAPAFDPAMRVRRGAGPLAWFGVHDAPLPSLSPGPGDARLVDVVPEIDAAASRRAGIGGRRLRPDRLPRGDLGVARALPPAARRPGGVPPHEGNGAARAMAGGGSGGAAPAPRLGEG